MEFFGDLPLLCYLFIYPVVYLFQYENMDVYWILWIIIHYFVLLFKLFQLWLLGTLTWLLYRYYIFSCLHVCLLSSSLFSGTTSTSGLFRMFSTPVLVLVFSPMILLSKGFFYWRIVFEPKIWVLGVLLVIEVPLVLGSLDWQSKKKHCVF